MNKLMAKMIDNLSLPIAHRSFCRFCFSVAQLISDNSSYHVFHTYADLPITVECTIEPHNVWRITLVQHLQLTNDLVSDCQLDF